MGAVRVEARARGAGKEGRRDARRRTAQQGLEPRGLRAQVTSAAVTPRLLVLQAYGHARILQEARFAVLTFLHFALSRQDAWKVVVYTDQPGAFAGLGERVVTE